MSGPYILPVADHLTEDEIDFELRLRRQAVDPREQLEDKKRLLRRLFFEEKKEQILRKGTHSIRDESKHIEANVNAITESLKKKFDRALISRLRHYLIRTASASASDEHQSELKSSLCHKIEESLKEHNEKLRMNSGSINDEDDIGKEELLVIAARDTEQAAIGRMTEETLNDSMKQLNLLEHASKTKSSRLETNIESKGAISKGNTKEHDHQSAYRVIPSSVREHKEIGKEQHSIYTERRNKREDRGQKRHTYHYYDSTEDTPSHQKHKRIIYQRSDRSSSLDSVTAKTTRGRHRKHYSNSSDSEYETHRSIQYRSGSDRKFKNVHDHRSRRYSKTSDRSTSRSRGYYRKSRVENWDLTFSGDSKSIQVEDFLNRVKKLARHEGVSDNELLRNIHHRLKGEAFDWWFTREDRFSHWNRFEDEIRFRYGNPNRDRGIRAQIRELKQRKGETFVAYVTEVEKLNQCLQRPFSSRTIFELIWENMRPHYRSRLSVMDIYDLEHLIRVNHKIDANDPNFYRPLNNVRTEIHNIEAFGSEHEYSEEENVQLNMLHKKTKAWNPQQIAAETQQSQ